MACMARCFKRLKRTEKSTNILLYLLSPHSFYFVDFFDLNK